MAEFDMDELLKKNPKAGRHADSVRKTLGALRELRETGLAGGQSKLEPPYKGGASVKNAPKPHNKRPIKARSKLDILLER